jgi:PAS domain S-box-containing protein
MITRFKELLRDLLLKAGKNDKSIRITISLAIVLPVVLIAAFAYFRTYQELTEFTLSRRQSIADLAATVLEQKLERLTDIGVSLATRVRFRQLINDGKWEEAIEILHGVSKDFPIIERIFLADSTGTLMADAPALPAVRGKNFATRDWYQGVSNGWKPYVSGVYQRAAEPRYNVIAAAIPIKAERENTVGILVLQVRLDTLIDWSKSIKVEGAGFVYVVDKEGRLAAHPKIPLQSQILDYSSVPVVQKVLRGQTGVQISFNPLEKEERIAAYAPVRGSGWGVIATEPTRTAFAKRDEDLKALLVRYGFIFLMSCVLAYVILRAVSARERAEADRQRFENLLNSIIENNPVMIFLKDAKNLRFVLFNKAAEEITGFKRDELIGKSDYDLFTKDDADFFTAKDHDVLKRRDVLDIPEESIQTRHHGLRVLHTRKMALLDHKGDRQYLLGVSEDITERKRAEESIRQLNIDLQKHSEQLQAANKELEAFSYSVSHDLRAPLRSIDGFSQALQEDYADKLDSEGKDHLQRVRASTQRMGQLIDDMLNLSRVTRGEMRCEAIDLTAMAEAIAADLQQTAPERDVEFVISEGLAVQGDARLLRILLDNLLNNAWKYTSKQPRARIEVGFAQNNGQSAYFVRDDGVGFDMAYADKLFGAFQRLHGMAEFNGTGIGLATVQRIIHRHGGRVWAQGKVDQGATFYFTI